MDGFEISIVDYDDLLKMKKETARPTDLIDIEKLEELRKTR
jgi:CO/xanthine dehydrogenase FAD-binding subunit